MKNFYFAQKFWQLTASVWRKRAPRFQPGFFDNKRGHFLFLALMSSFAVLFIRAFTIHLFPSAPNFLQNIADRQYQGELPLSPYRGTIYDRRGEPLAISIKMPSLFVNPRELSLTPNERQQLARILRLEPDFVRSIAKRQAFFAWLKRKVPREVAQRVMGMGIKGLYSVNEPARFYPAGQAAAHLIGYAGIDNRGLLGLERQFDNILKGHSARITESRDARGKIIFQQSSHAAPERPGENLYLSIDRAIQEIAERALAAGVEKAKANYGFAVVSDPHTGRILAVANYPGFDPNLRHLNKLKNTRNHAMTDTFEPGSVIKPFIIANALNLKKIRLQEKFDCESGIYREKGFRIRDTHPSKELDTTGILVESSNICTYKIAKRMGPEALFNTLKKFGFATAGSFVEFPGQTAGRILDWQQWRPVRFANISFGQGFTSTGLEIVRAFGAIANGGNLMEPYLVDHTESPDGKVTSSRVTRVVRQVLNADDAKRSREMLREVVEEGTGGNARMDEYSAAGKTGTSEKVDPQTRAYSPDFRIASFAGFTPVDDPHLVIYVVIDEPHVKPYYGGTWAAPVFKEIALNSLRYLNVAPDKEPPHLSKNLKTPQPASL